MEDKLGSKNLDDFHKQALCSNLEQLVTKLDSSHASIIQIVNSNIATDWLTNLSKNKDYHRGLLNQYQQTTGSGNQTSLVSSTSAGDNEPKENAVDTRHGETINAKKIVEVPPSSNTRNRKTTQYRQLAIIEKARNRNEARIPKS